MSGRTIAFLTDLGLHDDAVGMCKGMMLRISPGSPIVDVTHEVTPFDVREAAQYLGDMPPFFPDDAVFCIIVYPETGSGLGSIAVENRRGQLFVAADNGVLTLAVEEADVAAVHVVENPAVLEYPPSPSFYGRDVVVACGAHLAAGVPLEEVGPPSGPIGRLDYRKPRPNGDGSILGEITILDKNFGNVWTNVTHELCTRIGLADGELEIALDGHVHRWPLARTFSDVQPGEALAFFNSRDRLAFALNRGNLAAELDVRAGCEIEIRSVTVASR
jgi:S-adenosylmethionine hydrolase